MCVVNDTRLVTYQLNLGVLDIKLFVYYLFIKTNVYYFTICKLGDNILNISDGNGCAT